MDSFTLKIADQQWELDEICQLNHQTFSEEIPQHEKTATGFLVDKFHSENQYVICLNGNEIVGMAALRDMRPFSLDHKLNNLDDYLPMNSTICEIRLLIVKPKYRNSYVILHLFTEMFEYCIKKKYDLVVISGILAQQKFYRSFGFVPFGPLVGGEVKFQPMYSTPDFFFRSRHYLKAVKIKLKNINALPGPVTVRDSVLEEFGKPSVSHRCDDFFQNYKKISKSLSQIVNAKEVQIFTGSATLANEVMLAHLKALDEKGLILNNGEFGDRIVNQAKCQKIRFTEYKVALGEEFDIFHFEQILSGEPEVKWVFAVHCETSSGVLNDVEKITHICNTLNIRVLYDCVSTFGIIPLNLENVYMASASSGKAIGSYSGLSLVFFNSLMPIPENTVPLYLDIWYYIRKNGMPFTMNSNSLFALGTAVESIDIELKYKNIKEKSSWLRDQVIGLNYDVISLKSNALHPAIITIRLPQLVSSNAFGKYLSEHNITISYGSDYLVRQNLIQICLFSEITTDDLQYFVNILKHAATLFKD
ncbi:MAG: aminotransferase class V-fold PLP-dependent enzyme [Mariniphaga sp.]